jgi:hypothetical protein
MFRAFHAGTIENSGASPANEPSPSNRASEENLDSDWEIVSDCDFAISERQPEFEPPSPFAECIAAQTHVGAIIDDEVELQHRPRQDEDFYESIQVQQEKAEVNLPASKDTTKPLCYTVPRPTGAWGGATSSNTSNNSTSAAWSPAVSSCAHLFTLLSVSVVLCHTFERAMPVGFFGVTNNVLTDTSQINAMPVNATEALYNLDVVSRPSNRLTFLQDTIQVSLAPIANNANTNPKETSAPIVFKSTATLARAVHVTQVEPYTIRLVSPEKGTSLVVQASFDSNVPSSSKRNQLTTNFLANKHCFHKMLHIYVTQSLPLQCPRSITQPRQQCWS